MAGITQQVPNYIFGISEQPDELKVPGQVRDCINALPDVTRGLQKRPGTNLIGSLSTSAAGKWFHINRDNNEQYIGQVYNGTVKVWDAKTGSEKSVSGSVAGYLSTDDPKQIDVISVNDYTFITNKKKIVRMSDNADDITPDEKNYAFISLKQVKPGTQYALDIGTPGAGISNTFYRATNIELSSKPYSGGKSGDGSCEYAGRQLFGNDANNMWFEIDSRCTGVYEQTDGDGFSYDSYTNTCVLKFGGEGTPVGHTESVTMSNSGSSGGWSVEVTNADLVQAYADQALVRPAPTPFEGLGASADSILSGIGAELGSAFNWQIIGSGIYIERADGSPFVVSIPDPSLMSVIQNSADDVSQLPSSCKDGYIVRVVNSGEEEDDYWVKFIGDNGDGPGVWEETRGANLKFKFFNETMPVQLIRESSGNFKLDFVEWEERLVGDQTTNPKPSFVDEKITKLVFFRNRLGFISGENITLSRPGDFFNFWAKTATTVVPIDPIDISCSSQTPALIYEAIEVNAGLVMFGENQQFLMTTDSDVFSPRTAKINALSTYSYNTNTAPQSLGTSIAFLNDGGAYSRLFEMTGVSRDVEPTVIEQSKLVSKLITGTYEELAASKENSLVALGDNNSRTVWIYRYFNSGDKRIQSAWVKWLLPGNVVYHVIMDDVYYAVLNSGGITLQAINVKLTDTDLTSKSAYLDIQVTISTEQLTFDSATQTTTFAKPADFNLTEKVSAFTYDFESRWGTATVEGDLVTLLGDWTGTPLTLGQGYEMLVDFPTIYPQQKQGDSVRSDIRSSLTVHRIKLNLEDTNNYQTTLFRRGKPDYVYLYESTPSDEYRNDAVPYQKDKDQTVSVYERNTNVNIRLTSEYPCACTLLSMNWEGDYNPRYYKSV